MKKPIDKEYLENSFKNFDAEVSENKYLHNDDPSIHQHENKNILDKISESETGTLIFDGKEFTDGQDGLPGTNGKSAYEIAVDNGFSGTEAEWLDSLKGETLDIDLSNYVKKTDDISNNISTGTVLKGETPPFPVVDEDGYPTLYLGSSDKLRYKFYRIAYCYEELVTIIKNNFFNHTHGQMKTITYSTTEPSTVSEGEIVMVYEE